MQEVIATIRRMKDGESSEFHGSMKLGWVQLCPFCHKEVLETLQMTLATIHAW